MNPSSHPLSSSSLTRLLWSKKCVQVTYQDFLFDHQWGKWLVQGCTVAVIVEIMWHFMMILFLKLFRKGRNGRAFLFSHAMNVSMGPKEDRNLMTGLHTVADVYCLDCREVLGWKYERAYEESQKYKEGKFILEKSKIDKENW
uniref:Protein yippee-like n=1 Tax=Helianthus annuus TaxID=4232 RepID=A0A251VHH1_HELAN